MKFYILELYCNRILYKFHENRITGKVTRSNRGRSKSKASIDGSSGRAAEVNGMSLPCFIAIHSWSTTTL